MLERRRLCRSATCIGVVCITIVVITNFFVLRPKMANGDLPDSELLVQRKNNIFGKLSPVVVPTAMNRLKLREGEALTCVPNKSRNRLINLVGENRFDLSINAFVEREYKKFPKNTRYPPPFGVKGAESNVDKLLQELPETGLPHDIAKKSCRRCIVMGNSGILSNKGLGEVIDNYDMVIRMNTAPVDNFEQDVGSKTTFRLVYPEGAFRKTEFYHKNSTVVLLPFKALDFNWLTSMVTKNKLKSLKGFWDKIPTSLPKKPSQIRILNPTITQELAFDLIKFPINNGAMKKNVPTTGGIAIMFALRFCDELSVAGFGYLEKDSNVGMHYYDKRKMEEIKKSWVHEVNSETRLLKSLVQFGVINDLTGGLALSKMGNS